MAKYVIRGEDGMQFESLELETLGQEASWSTREQAEKALQDYQAVVRGRFYIEEIED